MKEKIPEKNKNGENQLKIQDNIEKFGIGHMDKVQFSIEDIPLKDKQGVFDAYNESTEKIRISLEDINRMLGQVQIDGEKQKIFDDFKCGIEKALYKTTNQILYHGKTDAKESTNAFDEFSMLLEVVHQSFADSEVINKKEYKDSAIYQIAPLQENIKHREVSEVNILLSKNHIAWDVISQSLYDTHGDVKSGIRLDYNPLYKEVEGEIDKSKTEWMTSVDVSGSHIDKILNQYSSRGHHFPKIFHYKVGLLISGFSNSLRKYFDNKKSKN